MDAIRRFLQSEEYGRRTLIAAMLFSIVVMVLSLFQGCMSIKPVKVDPQSVTVRVVSESGKDVKEDKANDLEIYEKKLRIKAKVEAEPELPHCASQIGDKILYTLWAYIGTSDALDLKRTIEVMKYRGLKTIEIYINSGGGSAFAGLACADVLIWAINSGFHVTASANGLVASAAVPIYAIAKPNRSATAGTSFMLHEGKMFKLFAEETKNDLRAQTKMMDLLDKRYNDILTKYTKIDISELEHMIAKTSWFTAQEAMEMGLVDKIE